MTFLAQFMSVLISEMVFLYLLLLPLPILGRMIIPPLPYSSSEQMKDHQVNVEIFYESLCPDSKNFFVDTLSPIISQFRPYISITLVPYGKAKTTKTQQSYQFSCQHGSAECQGNLYHNCAQKYITDQVSKIRLISCMFEKTSTSMSLGQTGTQWSGSALTSGDCLAS